MSQNQGNEVQAHVTIWDNDGNIVHNVRRTIRSIKNNGYKKIGQAKIRGRYYNVVATEWNWIGNEHNYE